MPRVLCRRRFSASAISQVSQISRASLPVPSGGSRYALSASAAIATGSPEWRRPLSRYHLIALRSRLPCAALQRGEQHAQQQHLGAGVGSGRQLGQCGADRILAQAQQLSDDLATRMVGQQPRAGIQARRHEHRRALDWCFASLH